jgi:hypothetical protein
MTIPELSNVSNVPERIIELLERQDPGSVTLQHLWDLARGLRHRLSIQLVPEKPPLPAGNAAVLEEFDRVMKEGKCRHFTQSQPDREHPTIVWDIAGDRTSNRLYVIATNPATKVRVGKACENTGGWSIEGQLFGIDVETNALAGELADQIIKEYKAELLGRGHRAKR